METLEFRIKAFLSATYGKGSGLGSCCGYSESSGVGYGNGSGYGSGYGAGYGGGSGSGNGYICGYGDGSGNGYGFGSDDVEAYGDGYGSDEWYGREGLCSVLINPQASKVTCMPACDCEVFEMNKSLREHHLQWNAEKKCVEPLPNEEEQTFTHFKFEPFDKVLVRDGDNDRWQPAFFSVLKEYYDRWRPAFFSVLKEDSAEKFGVIDGYLPTFYSQCIPYNDDTKHLLGTYDPYKPKA